jgi:DNA repair exonuclease SbcCD ATPase subunit
VNLAIKVLEIGSFKGIQHMLLELEGKNAVISGRNGTGKTSVCDAFLWLLFGKDSAGNKPDVKPRNSLGERVEGMESDVRAILIVDGKTVELRRQWHEVWSKDPASGAKVYSRDETLCWIDGVPVKLDKEYTPYVLGMVGGDENTFKLLTDLGAFMRLNWSDRRRELVKISGEDPDAELHARAEFIAIDDILKGASPEDAKKRLMEQRRALETELNTIPARIDELEKTMQPVSEGEVKAAQVALETLKAEYANIEAQLTISPEALAQTKAIYDHRHELEIRRAEIERNLRKPIEDALTDAEGKLAVNRRAAAALEASRQGVEDNLRRLEITLTQLKDQRKTKLDEWHNYDGLKYIAPDIGTTCPTCGQELPEERIQEAHEKHRTEWDAKRLASMDAIKADGVQLAERITKAEDSIATAKASLVTLDRQAKEADDGIALEAEITRLRASQPKAEENPAWKAATAEIEAIDAQIKAQSTDAHRDALNRRKVENREEAMPHNLVLSRRELTKSVQDRIEALGGKKRETGAQLARVEGDIDLLARYVRERCSALEESINRLFHTIRWKLFDIAKNGSLIDCCDATVNGIAYAPAELNTGACVNADIEIIRVLGNAYGVTVPCFVDNAERVNQISFPGGQRILLQVTDDADLTLTLEE